MSSNLNDSPSSTNLSGSRSTTKIVNIGSRKSALALVQAELVVGLLTETCPGVEFPIKTVMVQGDADKTTPFLFMGDKTRGSDAGKNIWTEEMEHMLGTGELDLLVHSLKDLPTTLPQGCSLGAVVEREDPSDSLVMKAGLPYATLDQLPDGSVVGTSSTRRKALLKRFYPSLVAQECRGNIDTRLKKLDAEDSPFTSILLATAGLNRMNMQHRITALLPPVHFPYAVGQGSIGVEIRTGDDRIQKILSVIEDKPSRWRCMAERALLRHLQGGCSSPIGVVCFYEPDTVESSNMLRLTGTVIHPQGENHITASTASQVVSDAEAEALGIDVAEKLLANGANNILDQIRGVGSKNLSKPMERTFQMMEENRGSV
ncbi:hypothetical protein MMC30_001547 [Trapelia coarctata]|nr:hypothetical protein [Trapelia coarctata]